MTFEPTAPTSTMSDAMIDIAMRAAACRTAYDDYAPGCNRRSTHDALYEVQRNLGAVDRWLNGENDQPIAWLAVTSTQEGRDIYRVHYAADALVAAIRYILEAEYYAGLRTLESIAPIDPWRYEKGKSQGEAERLRLSEGITFVFPTSVLGR